MKTITLEQLHDLINTHISRGGVVIDAYRGESCDVVAGAVLEEGDRGESLHLRCPTQDSGWGTHIPADDVLDVEDNVVSYCLSRGSSYLGDVIFLSPARVEDILQPQTT